MRKDNHMQARLPEDRKEKTLIDLNPGDVVYITPWSMWADYFGYLWIDTNTTFLKEPRGTANVEVTVLDNGYNVDASHSDYAWKTRSSGPSRDSRKVVEAIF